jgi:predicted neutral ceramidase superfamily lipid hydrolase
MVVAALLLACDDEIADVAAYICECIVFECKMLTFSTYGTTYGTVTNVQNCNMYVLQTVLTDHTSFLLMLSAEILGLLCLHVHVPVVSSAVRKSLPPVFQRRE